MTQRLQLRIAMLGAVAGLTCAAFAAPAGAVSLNPVVADCNAHGRLTQTYSLGELQTAISTLPADVKEYTDCFDVINRALLAQTGSHSHTGSGGGGSGGSFLPTPVIVILVLLVLAAATFGAMAVRRRRDGDGGGGSSSGPGGSGSPGSDGGAGGGGSGGDPGGSGNPGRGESPGGGDPGAGEHD
jgi:hypothetical protein